MRGNSGVGDKYGCYSVGVTVVGVMWVSGTARGQNVILSFWGGQSAVPGLYLLQDE